MKWNDVDGSGRGVFQHLGNTTEFLLSREEADWMHVAQNTDKWRGLLNTLMNLRIITCEEFPDYLSNYQLWSCAPYSYLDGTLDFLEDNRSQNLPYTKQKC
jgi:hypothetical protein